MSGEALYQAGVACEQAGDFPGAFDAFRRSARANPRVAAPYVGLSRVLMRNLQRAEAIACLERACSCEPSNHVVHTLLGQALVQDGQLERGREEFCEALRLKPASPPASLGLASLLEDLGEKPEAAAVYQDLLGREPGNANALAGLLGVAEGDNLAAAIDRARRGLATAEDRDAALVGFALGKTFARLEAFTEAFAAWQQANTARRRLAGPFDRDQFDRRIQRMIDLFSPAFFAARRDWGLASALPVFIVGLPRSGTTLTEQILASRDDVFGAGELDLLTDLATGTPDRLGRADLPWPETAQALSRELVGQIADEHLARLTAMAPAAAVRHIIDKQPLNFWHLGLVGMALPGAHVIHCTRDIRDNGLSIFAENFSPEQHWATDLSDIAHYWRGYRRLMAHWKAVSGLQILEADYEGTVEDLEARSRQLTSFLGLPWDPGVLAFHASERAVQTPSRWQVRRPLYASSVGRWRPYREYLAPLSAAQAEAGDLP